MSKIAIVYHSAHGHTEHIARRVAEGARSNVFVERDGCLLTPPLSSGALPGVLRGELLDPMVHVNHR